MMRIVWPMLLGLLFLAGQDAYAQEPMERVYATSQSSGGTPLLANVSNAGSAVDQNLTTFSTLSITLVGTVYQELNFPEHAPAGTPLRVKIGTGSDILGLLDNVQIRAYSGTDPVGASVALSSLVSLLAGADQDEIVFTPPGAYNRVRITSAGIALGGGFHIYEAYFYKPVTNDITCDQPVDVLYGSTGPIAGALNGVENPRRAIDGDPTRFATIKANLSALNTTHITALYPVASSAGDSVQLIIRNPAGLLDLTLLASNFTIKTYLDNLDNGELDLDPSLLRLRLLPGATDIQVLTYPVNQPFNRLEVSLGTGLANALGVLEVYELGRLAVGPTINETNNEDTYFACAGTAVTLTIENPDAGATYNWYDEAGVLANTGTSYTTGTLPVGNHIFYVTSTRDGCTTESGRTMVVVKVIETAVATDIDVGMAAPFCVGETIELSPSSTTISNPVFKWYHDQGKTQPITSGTQGSVNYDIGEDGTLTINGHNEGTYFYYVSVSNENTCENTANALKEVSITVQRIPNAPIIDLLTN